MIKFPGRALIGGSPHPHFPAGVVWLRTQDCRTDDAPGSIRFDVKRAKVIIVAGRGNLIRFPGGAGPMGGVPGARIIDRPGCVALTGEIKNDRMSVGIKGDILHIDEKTVFLIIMNESRGARGFDGDGDWFFVDGRPGAAHISGFHIIDICSLIKPAGFGMIIKRRSHAAISAMIADLVVAFADARQQAFVFPVTTVGAGRHIEGASALVFCVQKQEAFAGDKLWLRIRKIEGGQTGELINAVWPQAFMDKSRPRGAVGGRINKDVALVIDGHDGVIMGVAGMFIQEDTRPCDFAGFVIEIRDHMEKIACTRFGAAIGKERFIDLRPINGDGDMLLRISGKPAAVLVFILVILTLIRVPDAIETISPGKRTSRRSTIRPRPPIWRVSSQSNLPKGKHRDNKSDGSEPVKHGASPKRMRLGIN